MTTIGSDTSKRKGKHQRREATRVFLEEAKRTAGFSRFDFLHGYVYARWLYLYIGIGTGEHWLSKGVRPLVNLIGKWLMPKKNGNDPTVAETYHGKVVPLEAARQLVTIHEPIRLTNLEQVIPYRIARDIILNDPDHIVVIECPCRSSRPNPCTPLDVCLIIGEPFASFAVEHHPRRARWITSKEAQDILQAEHRRGHVHHAFFKDAMLGRFYAICNCCSCCCGAMQAMRNGSPMLISSGYISRIDEDSCIGCEACVEVCPFGALSFDGRDVLIDSRACMGCGVCVSTCEQGALSLVRDPQKPMPLEINQLIEDAAMQCL